MRVIGTLPDGTRGSSPLSCFLHDLYHLFLESTNPHRKIWIAFAKFAKDRIAEADYYKILDREFPDYREVNLRYDDQFLKSLELLYSRTMAKIKLIKLFSEFYQQNKNLFSGLEKLEKRIQITMIDDPQ